MLMVIVLAPVIVIGGEPLRQYCLKRFGWREPVHGVIECTVVRALTAPSRWVINFGGRRLSRIGRRRGPGGDWPPPSDVDEPRRPRPTAPAGAIALAEPRVERRVIPIRKARLSVLSEAVRRVRKRLHWLAGLPRGWVTRQPHRAA